MKKPWRTWKKLRDDGFQNFLKDEERKAKLVTQKEYLEYLELKERIEAQEFRVEDNKNQKYKGRMSLDDEDTGVQYWNDPVEKKRSSKIKHPLCSCARSIYSNIISLMAQEKRGRVSRLSYHHKTV